MPREISEDIVLGTEAKRLLVFPIRTGNFQLSACTLKSDEAETGCPCKSGLAEMHAYVPLCIPVGGFVLFDFLESVGNEAGVDVVHGQGTCL